MNNTYKITMRSPLLRPGITIETEVSEQYVRTVVATMMEIVRDINNTETNANILTFPIDKRPR